MLGVFELKRTKGDPWEMYSYFDEILSLIQGDSNNEMALDKELYARWVICFKYSGPVTLKRHTQTQWGERVMRFNPKTNEVFLPSLMQLKAFGLPYATNFGRCLVDLIGLPYRQGNLSGLHIKRRAQLTVWESWKNSACSELQEISSRLQTAMMAKIKEKSPTPAWMDFASSSKNSEVGEDENDGE